ncbi:hypothetical protein QIS74_02879 [Colletotrichum tabaci]|uniref:Uncharacterized protein n=1 Tax=Colletotrichum tabaci TaxID=1209068 RepID=A0AAV9TMK9_9PEZI
MSIKETFPRPEDGHYRWPGLRENRDRDLQAMNCLRVISDSMSACELSNIDYASGSWGYTVLRTTYSDESDRLWPAAMDKLKRWVTEYFVHLNRLITNKLDGTLNDEVARRFVLEVVETEELRGHELSSKEHVESLVRIFEIWRHGATGSTDFDTRDNPRFCDFLVIDEDALRSLAALPDETPHLGPVSRADRRARIGSYIDSYVWLVDSRAVNRYQGVEDGDNYEGWMRLCSEDIYYAWFEKAGRSASDHWTFEQREIPPGSGIKWYQAR